MLQCALYFEFNLILAKITLIYFFCGMPSLFYVHVNNIIIYIYKPCAGYKNRAASSYVYNHIFVTVEQKQGFTSLSVLATHLMYKETFMYGNAFARRTLN